MRLLYLFFIFLVYIHPVQAAATLTPEASLAKLYNLLIQGEHIHAKDYVTERSSTYYDRIMKVEPETLLPDHYKVIDNVTKHGFTYLRVQEVPVNPSMGTAVLAFDTSTGAARLDIPETLRRAFGENWQARFDMIEQSYLMASQHLGEAQSKEMLKGLLRRKSPSTGN